MPKHDVHDPFDHDMVASMPQPDLGRLSFRREGQSPPRSLATQLRDHAISRIGLDPSNVDFGSTD